MTANEHDEDDSAAALRRQFAAVRGPATAAHPSEDDWARFAARELDAAAQAAFADHIVDCAECAQIYRAVALMRKDAPGIDAEVQAIGRHASWWQGLAAAAAIVGLMAGSVWWLTRAADDEAPQETRQGPVGPAPSSVSTEALGVAGTTTPGAERVERWAQLAAAPEVRLPPSLVLTMRGANAADQAFLAEFGAAIAPYRAGRYAEAAPALALLTERRPGVTEVWFYLGVSRLYSQMPADAVEPLRRAQASEVVGDEARWLEAVALQLAGRPTEARAVLSAICAAPGPSRARACAALAPAP